jgi:hypothetical protein
MAEGAMPASATKNAAAAVRWAAIRRSQKDKAKKIDFVRAITTSVLLAELMRF